MVSYRILVNNSVLAQWGVINKNVTLNTKGSHTFNVTFAPSFINTSFAFVGGVNQSSGTGCSFRIVYKNKQATTIDLVIGNGSDATKTLIGVSYLAIGASN